MQLEQPRANVFLRRIDCCLSTERQCALEPLGGEVERNHFLDAAVGQPEHHAESNGTASKHNDLVAGLGLRAVDAVQGYGERFGQRSNFEGQVVRDRQQAVTYACITDQELFREGAFRAAAADVAGSHHRVDDNTLPDGDTLYVAADSDYFACGFMTDGRYAAGLSMNTAYLDVGEIAAADTAGLHLHHNVGISRTRRLSRVQPDVIHAMNVEYARHIRPVWVGWIRDSPCRRHR